jgi:hypothetical protein
MLLILLTLCQQPVGFILQDSTKFTIYKTDAAPYVIPELLDKIESSVTIPIDNLTDKGKCA